MFHYDRFIPKIRVHRLLDFTLTWSCTFQTCFVSVHSASSGSQFLTPIGWFRKVRFANLPRIVAFRNSCSELSLQSLHSGNNGSHVRLRSAHSGNSGSQLWLRSVHSGNSASHFWLRTIESIPKIAIHCLLNFMWTNTDSHARPRSAHSGNSASHFLLRSIHSKNSGSLFAQFYLNVILDISSMLCIGPFWKYRFTIFDSDRFIPEIALRTFDSGRLIPFLK